MVGKNQSGKNLLIVSCSQRKRKLKGKVKAWDLYDGVIFRMLKKIERENGLPKNLDILILSAKYGFIRPSDLIKYYDYRLKKKDIESKRKSFVSSLRQKTKDNKIATVFVCLGKDYRKSIEGFEILFSNKAKFSFANGGIGKKMSQVKNWLWVFNENIGERL